ncbi:hypothetical protein DT076_16745 [Desertihabitans brevis]|uniref:Uncharacterized protein n=1 Tax=Desertihabitans brevis TaxID=2268447 RepID=A0A367YQX9_9ACTN|nr:hypothetical protein [Desertihabitans brevis]RCK68295.1 hypothetical protein DT076_16745 [Desertihabitans brevis]
MPNVDNPLAGIGRARLEARRRATAQRLRAARQAGLQGAVERYTADLAAIDSQLDQAQVTA